MARFIDEDEVVARGRLAAAGVRILRADDPGLSETLEAVLAGATAERGRTVATPPPDEGAAATGMGAWHVNDVSECHTVLDGTGIAQFWTAQGPVSVLLEGGDIMCVERAEHRYRPLTPQGWVLRFGGPDDAELTGSPTLRQAGPWPKP